MTTHYMSEGQRSRWPASPQPTLTKSDGGHLENWAQTRSSEPGYASQSPYIHFRAHTCIPDGTSPDKTNLSGSVRKRAKSKPQTAQGSNEEIVRGEDRGSDLGIACWTQPAFVFRQGGGGRNNSTNQTLCLRPLESRQTKMQMDESTDRRRCKWKKAQNPPETQELSAALKSRMKSDSSGGGRGQYKSKNLIPGTIQLRLQLDSLLGAPSSHPPHITPAASPPVLQRIITSQREGGRGGGRESN
ncbi:MAG: hypothetical protein FRX49_13013 [Trebouxia sp. A1-2]|nr:MAG: hypothetical protein FRX49_13013 [Trebouxia sp. A1-2]